MYWGQCHETFYVRDLWILVLSSSVCQTRPEKLTNDKHSSLLRKSVNYGQRKIYNIGPLMRNHKTSYELFFCNFFRKLTSLENW